MTKSRNGRLTLARELGLLGLVATAVCTVIGGGINVLSVQIQARVPDVGPLVPVAFLVGVFPAMFGALAYAVLASSMPRAGGGYMYTSRGLHPFMGFMATFSKWFGLAAVTGAIAFADIPLLADAAHHASQIGARDLFLAVEDFLRSPAGSIGIPLAMVWLFWLINLLGIHRYEGTVTLLMFLMLIGGVAIIFTGFLNSYQDYAQVLIRKENIDIEAVAARAVVGTNKSIGILKAAAMLFFAYLGFATISQAGGEVKNPRRNLPLAFVISTIIITSYYLLFSGAIYHAIPAPYIQVKAAELQAAGSSVTAAGLMGFLMPEWLAVFVILMAALALLNDIPPMLLAVSRLFFSWAEDGVFPSKLAALNKKYRTPHWALTISAAVGSLVVMECYFHGFFAGVDITVTALLFTYILVATTVLSFPKRNPQLYGRITFLKNRAAQITTSLLAIVSLGLLLGMVIHEDLTSVESAWYWHTTWVWLIVMAVGAAIFVVMWKRMRVRGIDPEGIFNKLPYEYEASR